MDLVNVPGGGELWRVGTTVYLVYWVPGASSKVPMAWRVTDPAALTAITNGGPVTYARQITEADAAKAGMLVFGVHTELKNTEKHPFEEFLSNYEDEARVQPMLRDPEILAIFASALLEGRQPTSAEIENSRYWRSRTPEQRAWERTAAADPKAAAQQLEANRIQVRDQLLALGYEGDADALARHWADRWTTGAIGEVELRDRLRREVDPNAPGASPFAGRYAPEGAQAVTKDGRYYLRVGGKDYRMTGEGQVARFGGNAVAVASINEAGTLEQFFAGQGDPQGNSALGGVEEVRALVQRWLGPAFAAGWSQRHLEEWASRIRQTPGAVDQLEDELRRQRQAVLPNYDENLTYEDIATPWRGVVSQAWGEMPSEEDPFFVSLLNLNDMNAAQQVLRQEGLRRNNGTVIDGALQSLQQSFGGRP